MSTKIPNQNATYWNVRPVSLPVFWNKWTMTSSWESSQLVSQETLKSEDQILSSASSPSQEQNAGETDLLLARLKIDPRQPGPFSTSRVLRYNNNWTNTDPGLYTVLANIPLFGTDTNFSPSKSANIRLDTLFGLLSQRSCSFWGSCASPCWMAFTHQRGMDNHPRHRKKVNISFSLSSK